MKTSAAGLQLIQNEEGCVLHIYPDQAGIPTIGIGHKLTQLQRSTHVININGVAVDISNGITNQQALDLLAQDVIPAENEINSAVTAVLNQNQFDALVDFTFNCGDGAFASSSALVAINAGDFGAVPVDLAKWNKDTVNGQLKVCQDLVDRRAREGQLFAS